MCAEWPLLKTNQRLWNGGNWAQCIHFRIDRLKFSNDSSAQLWRLWGTITDIYRKTDILAQAKRSKMGTNSEAAGLRAQLAPPD